MINLLKNSNEAPKPDTLNVLDFVSNILQGLAISIEKSLTEKIDITFDISDKSDIHLRIFVGNRWISFHIKSDSAKNHRPEVKTTSEYQVSPKQLAIWADDGGL